MLRYLRAHGLGNDYIVVDTSDSTMSCTPSCVRYLCDRHRGLGADGLLLPVPATRADFGVRIFNQDGSEAEKSGNGLRIFARYLHDGGRFNDVCSIDTRAGPVRARAHRMENGRLEFSVDMGRAVFATADIPVKLPGPEAVDVPLEVAGHRFCGTAVSLGNPHWVVFVDEPEAIPLLEIGPAIEHHPWFPHRTNVQFARVLEPGCAEIRVWERGVGETLASGSSACAVVAAGVRTGRLGKCVRVRMTGGSLLVQIDPDGELRQRGPVSVIATGTVSAELEAYLVQLSGEDSSKASQPPP